MYYKKGGCITLDTLKNGFIKSQISLENDPYEIKRLNKSMIPEIVALHSYDMKNEALFLPLTAEELELILDKKGIMVGAFVNDKLVGYHSAFFPREDKENLGRDLCLKNDDLYLVFHMEASFVMPEYRGNSLQKIMSFILIDLIKEMQSYQYLCETVAPDNIASIKSTLAINTLIVKLKVKYSGQLRYIFFQDIFKPLVVDTATTVKIAISDIPTQKELLDKGYYGYEMTTKGTDTYMSFAKCKE